MEHLSYRLHRMVSANTLQGTLLHGLRIAADTGDTALHHSSQLRLGHAVRPPGLHREFHRMLATEAIPYQMEHISKISIRQAGRCTAPHIDGLYLEAVFLHQLSCCQQILAEGCHKTLNALLPRQNMGRK